MWSKYRVFLSILTTPLLSIVSCSEEAKFFSNGGRHTKASASVDQTAGPIDAANSSTTSQSLPIDAPAPIKYSKSTLKVLLKTSTHGLRYLILSILRILR